LPQRLSSHHFDDAEALADEIVCRIGNRIVLALPLGLGKANHVANALYERAARDQTIDLHIFTALTLEKPRYGDGMERRFLQPVIERLFGDYPELLYARALREGTLPHNIEVNEFFLLAGRWLHVPAVQRAYICANYTHAAREVMRRGVNVVAQLVARRGNRYSLSCNTDLTLDLLKAREGGKVGFFFAAQVNADLPFMPGEGDVSAETFDAILESPQTQFSLFAPPKEPVDLAEYAIGLHVARLVPDGGTLQIGIGQEGDAAVHGLLLRHGQNAAFRELQRALNGAEDGELGPFGTGLYGLSEMFVDGFLALLKAGILKREVDGAILHAAFFLGPKAFYQALRELDDATKARLRMSAVSFTNELYGDEDAKRAARKDARFINSAMMATLLGAVVSDGLEDGRVVSGVGGQFNFVAQAFALDGARSIITMRATRETNGRVTSNIRFVYGHETIPRHLRDMIVTEYGVADLRGRSDEGVVKAMLAIADSRFQPALLSQAKRAQKIDPAYEIPETQRRNTPERIEAALAPFRARGDLPPFPLGTDFNATEQRLVPALGLLKQRSTSVRDIAALALRGALARLTAEEVSALRRMGLEKPATMGDHFSRALLQGALRSTR
jgi:acyl-CoA hydrolase